MVDKTLGDEGKNGEFILAPEDELRCNTDHFSLLSYNVLSQFITEKYNPSDEPHMQWEHRRKLLRDQLLQASADIVCLQEVDLPTFENDFGDLVYDALGYEAVFPRSRQRNKPFDWGNVILFNMKKFELVWTKSEARSVRAVLQWKKAEEMEPRTYGNMIFIANVHLKGKETDEPLRIAEIHSCVSNLAGIAQQFFRKRNNGKCKVLITGDFNAESDSRVYRYLQTGGIPLDKSIAHKLRTKRKLKKNGTLSHPFVLKDAFATSDELSELPSYVGKMRDMSRIDYIWHSEALQKVGVRIPLSFKQNQQMCEIERVCPDEHHPSDHLMIGAVFKVS